MTDATARRSLLPHLSRAFLSGDGKDRAQARQHRRAAAQCAQDFTISTRAFAKWTSSAITARCFPCRIRRSRILPRPARGWRWRASPTNSMAELCVKHPDRFAGFVAALCLTDVMGSVEEAKRAIRDLGAAGVQIFTPLNGRPLDEPAFEPLFAAMAQLDRPIWLHPARTAAMPDYAAEQKSRFEMWWCFGWPYDTSVAMVRLVFCGLFDRYPNLKIVTHHLGGMIPFYDGRIGPGLDVLGARTSDEDYSRILPSLKRPHLDYFRDFYADTAMFGGGVHALRCGFRVLRGRQGRVRHRHAARSDQTGDRGAQQARHFRGRSPQDSCRQCGEIAEEEIELAARSERLISDRSGQPQPSMRRGGAFNQHSSLSVRKFAIVECPLPGARKSV